MLEQQGRYHHNSLLYHLSHRQYFLSIEGRYTVPTDGRGGWYEIK